MREQFKVGDEIGRNIGENFHYMGIVTNVYSWGFTADIYSPSIIKGYRYHYYHPEHCDWTLLKSVNPIQRLNDKVKDMWERQPYIRNKDNVNRF